VCPKKAASSSWNVELTILLFSSEHPETGFCSPRPGNADGCETQRVTEEADRKNMKTKVELKTSRVS
jgi:hypothetical protein